MSLSADVTRLPVRGSVCVIYTGDRFPLAASDLSGEAL